MGFGILVCGLNGCGKSTLGQALAQALGCRFIDNEDLYFPKTDPNNPFASPRSRQEVVQLLLQETQTCESFVFASVRGEDYEGEAFCRFTHIVLMQVPKPIRLARVRQRSRARFGARIDAGGDLYEQEQRFFRMVEGRREDLVTNWLQKISLPTLCVDGTLPLQENIAKIQKFLQV